MRRLFRPFPIIDWNDVNVFSRHGASFFEKHSKRQCTSSKLCLRNERRQQQEIGVWV
jgi:hypothetical protein